MKSYREAFAQQAKADMDTYYHLVRSGLPSSQSLHFLQMWLEKLCKSYLWPDSELADLRYRHNVVAKVLPVIVSKRWKQMGFAASPDIAELREVCRQVDLLHPQVDDSGRRPDNTEYPWLDSSGEAQVPSLATFRLSARLHSPAGKLLLKAASSLTQKPSLLP